MAKPKCVRNDLDTFILNSKKYIEFEFGVQNKLI